MILTYKPDGVEPRSWTFRPQRLQSAEAEALEDETGWTHEELGQKFLAGSMRAKRAVLWMLLRRANTALTFRELSICADDLQVELELDEVAAYRQAVEDADGALDRQQKAFARVLLDRAEAQAKAMASATAGAVPNQPAAG